MPEPKLLILDEPCAGLDIFSGEYLLNTITQISAQATIIYVIHHTDEILPIFSRAALMSKGSFHSQGGIREVFSGENLSDFFKEPTAVSWSKDKVEIRVNAQLAMPQAIWQQGNKVSGEGV